MKEEGTKQSFPCALKPEDRAARKSTPPSQGLEERLRGGKLRQAGGKDAQFREMGDGWRSHEPEDNLKTLSRARGIVQP